MVTPQPTRVLCVDDNDLVCQALERKFSGLDEFVWCGTLPDATSLVARALECRPHIVLLDLDMPGPHALTQMRSLVLALPDCRVIVLSGLLSETLVEQALDAGAWGYLSKGEASADIIDAVRRVAAGEAVLGAEVRLVCRRSAAAIRP